MLLSSETLKTNVSGTSAHSLTGCGGLSWWFTLLNGNLLKKLSLGIMMGQGGEWPVEDIRQFLAPTNKKELMRFLGMAESHLSFFGRFLKLS